MAVANIEYKMKIDKSSMKKELNNSNAMIESFATKSGLALDSSLMQGIVKANGGIAKFAKNGLDNVKQLATEAGIQLPKGFDKAYLKMSVGLTNWTKTAGKKMMTWGNKMSNIVGGIMGAGLAMSSVKEYGELAKSLRQVKMLKADVDINRIKDATDQLENTMGVEATDAVNAFYQALSAGNSEDESHKLMVLATNLAATGAAAGDLTDIKGAMDGLTNTINAFKRTGISASEAADKMAVSIIDGKTSINEMAESIGSVAPLANTLGLSLDDVLAPLDALTSQGVSTNSVMTQLKAIMSGFMKPAGDMGGLLSDLGYESGQAMLSANGLAGSLEIISEHIKENNGQWVDYFENLRSLQGTAGLMGTKESMDKLAESAEALKNSTGTLAKQTKIYMGDPATKWSNGINKMKNAIGNLIDMVGGDDGLVGVMKKLIWIVAAFKVGSIIAKLFELATAFSAVAVAKGASQAGIMAPFVIAGITGAIAAGMAAVGASKLSGAFSGGSSDGTNTQTTSANQTVTINVSMDETGKMTATGNGKNANVVSNVGRGGDK